MRLQRLTAPSSFQLSLAHYCDLHGPTPLMVTEGLPIPCTTCHDHDASSAASIPRSTPATTAPTTAPSDAMRDLSISTTSRPRGPSQASALETPPVSPRPTTTQPRRDSSFRRTYDDTVTRKQGPCDNCAMTLPKRSTATNADSSVSNTNKGPTLRTRAPAERVFGSAAGSAATSSHSQSQFSPPNSQSSSDTDGETERRSRNRTGGLQSGSSRTTSCSSASTVSEGGTFHVHYVDYTSTHEPVLPTSFSLLRASCLRTLSFETLPRAPSVSTSAIASTPTPSSSMSNSIASPTSSTGSFVTTQSAGSAVSGGPIFFGDSLAGYTTAYIFRIPDVHARGHKRVYAFLALSTHKERLAMKTFAIISSAFRELATWIQTMAETEAERAAESSPSSGAFISGGGAGQQPPSSQSQTSDQPDRSSGSSFLTGGSGFTRRMGTGGGASAPKARGLAELVGQPDFFIELHRRFVQLLFEVGVTLNS